YSIDGGVTLQGSNMFTGLGAATYTITIIDANNCTTTTSETITTPSNLTASSIFTNDNCFGGSDGSMTVTAAGGTATFEYSIDGGTTYQVSNIFNGLGVGSHTVTVRDDNGCTVTTTQNITQPAVALSATTTDTDVTCFGAADGEITVTANGGTAAYEYSIDGGTT